MSMTALLPVDEVTPRSLMLVPPLSDAEFQALCQMNDSFRFERTREGMILMHAPTGVLTSDGNAEVNGQLRDGGFFLPGGSMLNPDASYVLPEKLKGLTKDDLTGFPYLCPDFIIELLSASDSEPAVWRKIECWRENGVALGWLIHPYKKQVYIYEPGCEVTAISGKAVHGNGPVEGFALDLDEVWRCYEV